MKKLISLTLALALALSLVGCGGTPAASGGSSSGGSTASSQGAQQEKYDLVFAATSSSSGYYALCVALGDVINTHVDNVTVTIMETGGTMDDYKYMRDGQAAFGQTNDVQEYLLQNDSGAYKDFGYTNARDLVFCVPQLTYNVVSKTSGVASISDLAGKQFNAGLSGSTSEIDTMAIFGAIGVEPDYFPASTADAIEALQNRRIDGFCKAGSQLSVDSSILNVQSSVDIDILSFTEEEIAAVQAVYPYYAFETVSGDDFGLDHDITSNAVHMGYCIDGDIPEEVGYEIFKAIAENQDEIRAAYPGIVDDVVEFTAIHGSSLLHPGVVKYLQEQGYTIDEIRIPG